MTQQARGANAWLRIKPYTTGCKDRIQRRVNDTARARHQCEAQNQTYTTGYKDRIQRRVNHAARARHQCEAQNKTYTTGYKDTYRDVQITQHALVRILNGWKEETVINILATQASKPTTDLLEYDTQKLTQNVIQ
jgi:hypothetical protein